MFKFDIFQTNDDDSVGISLHGSGWGRPPPTEPTDYDSDISMPVRRGNIKKTMYNVLPSGYKRLYTSNSQTFNTLSSINTFQFKNQ